MIREVVKIDESLCDGCGLCVPNCHEGALQIIDGKARLISDLLCDGLGACIGHCPQGAITVEKREAEPYDEVKALQYIIPKGKNTVVAHLKHLRDHNETGFMKEAMTYMKANSHDLPFDLNEVIREMHRPKTGFIQQPGASGCPGSQSKTINQTPSFSTEKSPDQKVPSQLKQWPVQMHLINPAASHFQGTDLLLAADCVAFAMGDFHNQLLKGKTLAIACPKLDQGMNVYMEKIIRLVDEARINTITVAMMEV
ncbi:MAG: ATP-binding protein, partial [Marinilabiliaceae bacterium]